MDIINWLGPISRIICLSLLCAWVPMLPLLYLQAKRRNAKTDHHADGTRN